MAGLLDTEASYSFDFCHIDIDDSPIKPILDMYLFQKIRV